MITESQSKAHPKPHWSWRIRLYLKSSVHQKIVPLPTNALEVVAGVQLFSQQYNLNQYSNFDNDLNNQF